MLEKEIKILDIDVPELEKRLIKLGAKKTFEGEIHDVYYDFPDTDDNLKMENNNRMFRVRKRWEEHIYTIKRKRKEFRKEEWVIAKDEHETPITNVESFAKVLEKYGMKKTREKIKHRISYNLDGAEFDIDVYKSIPAFVEIEETSRSNIDEWIKKLWLEDHEILLWGSRKIFAHYWVEYLNFDWKKEEK